RADFVHRRPVGAALRGALLHAGPLRERLAFPELLVEVERAGVESLDGVLDLAGAARCPRTVDGAPLAGMELRHHLVLAERRHAVVSSRGPGRRPAPASNRPATILPATTAPFRSCAAPCRAYRRSAC